MEAKIDVRKMQSEDLDNLRHAVGADLPDNLEEVLQDDAFDRFVEESAVVFAIDSTGPELQVVPVSKTILRRLDDDEQPSDAVQFTLKPGVIFDQFTGKFFRRANVSTSAAERVAFYQSLKDAVAAKR